MPDESQSPIEPSSEQPRTEKGQLLPMTEVTTPVSSSVPPDVGQPAQEHLGSNGTFATVNPAGTVVRPDGVQVDVGTEVPPSLEKLRHDMPTSESLGNQQPVEPGSV